ncbi:hypothetical protein JKP88DRAFT_339853 [Tribonema minus]|uniref:RING-type E3 ubiquitin transferase n=1 Tax=Tribonema minus TaxID=303371 RepID=A0A836C800_9STRA|nr:hypothetical protein JKP88DRAFT_339853 [Tribonema minus]
MVKRWFLLPDNGSNRPRIELQANGTAQQRACCKVTVDGNGAVIEYAGPEWGVCLLNTTRLTQGQPLPLFTGDEVKLERGGGAAAGASLYYVFTCKTTDHGQLPSDDEVAVVDKPGGIGAHQRGQKRQRTEPGTAVALDPPQEPVASDPAGTAGGEGGSAVLKDILEDFTCPICHDIMVEATSLNCGHQFCFSCGRDWLAKCTGSKTCPKCLAPATVMVPCLAFDSTIARVVESEDVDADDRADYGQRRNAAKAARGDAARAAVTIVPAAAAAAAPTAARQFIGGFMMPPAPLAAMFMGDGGGGGGAGGGGGIRAARRAVAPRFRHGGTANQR